jgi:hypothetical protein
VVAFVRSNLPTDIRRANFVVVLEWLKNLSGKDDMPLQEACILTLCGLAMCVSVLQPLATLSHDLLYIVSRKMKRRTSFSFGSWSTSVIQTPTFAPWLTTRCVLLRLYLRLLCSWFLEVWKQLTCESSYPNLPNNFP